MYSPMSELNHPNRRALLKTGGAVAASLPIAGFAQAGGSDEIKVALIGCGGRGRGAATQTLNVPGTKLVAVADAFRDNAEKALKGLKERFKERVDVPAERI
ncbi:gfo/Idh/MocA family oxidoreductase, partial [Akkermansiaceae bacterium]|nr:gfo/Idh/MocA family oxidoreductase [Akkermansiaceae bacterium]